MDTSKVLQNHLLDHTFLFGRIGLVLMLLLLLVLFQGTERTNAQEIKVDTINYKSPAGHDEEKEEPQKEDVKITHVPLTYEKRGTGESLAAKIAEKIESATGAGKDTEDHNKKE